MAESFNDFVAGYISGVAGLVVGSPLDVVKVRLQSQAQTRGPLPPLSNALADLVRYEGAGSLFKGITSPIIGLAGLNSILFASYGGILRFLETPQKTSHLAPAPVPSLGNVFLAGFGAGVACSIVSTPTELIKCRAQMSTNPLHGDGSWRVAKEVMMTQGIRGFYKGGLITILRDAPGYGVNFWAFEGMKHVLDVPPGSATNSNIWKLLLAGGIAGVISWLTIYPFDVIKTRLQVQPDFDHAFALPRHSSPSAHGILRSLTIANLSHLIAQPIVPPVPPINLGKSHYGTTSPSTTHRHYAGILDCAIRSFKFEGTGVFIPGLAPTLIRAFPVNGVVFLVYEAVIDLLRAMEKRE